MKDDIARARQHVDLSEKQVAWQRRLVADLKERGYATRREAEQLSVFESSLCAYQAAHTFLTQREAAPRLSPTKQTPQSASGAKA